MSEPLREIVWHPDGHTIYLRIEKDQLTVNPGPCPFDDREDSKCFHRGMGGCVVNYFILMYGLDINQGICSPHDVVPVAWAFHGDPYDVDAAQVWVIPTQDDNFKSWLNAQSAENEEQDGSD